MNSSELDVDQHGHSFKVLPSESVGTKNTPLFVATHPDISDPYLRYVDRVPTFNFMTEASLYGQVSDF